MGPLTAERSAASSSPAGDAHASAKSTTAKRAKQHKVEKAADLEIL
jgi:hypothetical protein